MKSPGKGLKRPQLFGTEEQHRTNSGYALKSAFDLRKEVSVLKGSYIENVESFFTDSSNDSSRNKSAGKILTVGTDCSGMEVPIYALQSLQIQHRHVFSSDKDPAVRKTILANCKPEELVNDIKTVKMKNRSTVDLYIAGFPCQSFSQAGKQQGIADDKGRGDIFYNVYDYIKTHQPKVFILENVKGLVSINKGKDVKHMLQLLRDIKRTEMSSRAYELHHAIINTNDHGVPQNRPRWYCVGIRRDTFAGGKSVFAFPKAIPRPSIELFLDGKTGDRKCPSSKSTNATTTTNIQKATC